MSPASLPPSLQTLLPAREMSARAEATAAAAISLRHIDTPREGWSMDTDQRWARP